MVKEEFMNKIYLSMKSEVPNISDKEAMFWAKFIRLVPTLDKADSEFLYATMALLVEEFSEKYNKPINH